MATPKFEDTEQLTEAEVDELVKQAKRDVLLAHLRNTDVQVEKKDNTARLGVRLKRWIRGELEDDAMKNVNAILQKFDEMKASFEETTERLEQRVMKVEKGERRDVTTAENTTAGDDLNADRNAEQQPTPKLPALKAEPPPMLDYGDDLEEFEEWCCHWENNARLKNLDKYPQVQQVSKLQENMTIPMQGHVRHNLEIAWDGSVSTKDILRAIGARLRGHRSLVLDRLLFEERKQEENEDFDKFHAALCKLAIRADLCTHCRDDRIASKIIAGIRKIETRKKLLEEQNLTLAQVKNKCIAAEISDKNTSELTGKKVLRASSGDSRGNPGGTRVV